MAYRMVLAVLAACLLMIGCGGDEFMTSDMDANSDPAGYTVAIAATPDNINIQAGGSITVMVAVTDPAGEGVDSVVVTMTSTMGALAETSLTTDGDGFAVTTLTAPDLIGYGAVVATYRGIQAVVQIDFWSSSTEGATGA